MPTDSCIIVNQFKKGLKQLHKEQRDIITKTNSKILGITFSGLNFGEGKKLTREAGSKVSRRLSGFHLT